MDSELSRLIPRDDIYLFNTGCAQKAWLSFGCTFVPECGLHRFLVWAPYAVGVSLVGSFNGWDPSRTPMEKAEGGVWAAFVPDVRDGEMYKFCVDGADGVRRFKADPFAAYSQCGADTASIVHTGSYYQWSDGDYMAQRRHKSFMSEPMSVYELHAGSWREYPQRQDTYRRLAEELPEYLRSMGYTHVELMPLTEYPYDGSWGYQVTGYYAPTSRYGTPEDFMYLIDRLHGAGIGVILDWVPAHFPRDEHALARFDGSPLFECKEQRMAEHPEWGTLIFDYASPQVQSFLVSSACKLAEVYHIDGLRVDAVSSMLYLNYARREGEYTPNREGGAINLDAVDFLKKLNSTVLTAYPGVITVAEEATAYPLITAPPDSGGLGFCLKWDMGFMHDTLDYMATDPYFRSGCHNKLTFSMFYAFSENYVLAFSHDEVVHGKKSMLSKMFGDYGQKFASLRAMYGLQFGHPGKKLGFMGGEFGQFIEWDEKKGLDWLLLDYPMHKCLQDYCRALNALYTQNPAMYRVDRSWDGFKWLNVDDRSRSSVAFLRSAPAEESYIVCACNFTPVRYDGFTVGLPGTGTLREILNSDDERFGGSGVKNEGSIRTVREPFLDLPCSARLTLPPMSAVFFRFKLRKGMSTK